jgi:hypothetical protein
MRRQWVQGRRSGDEFKGKEGEWRKSGRGRAKKQIRGM